MSDHSELKKLAEYATPGPWVAQHPNAGQRGSEVASEGGLNQVCADLGPSNALYIAAANPAAVLALIAEVEALRKDAERYKWLSAEGNWVARMFGKWRAHVGEYGDSAPTEWHDTREEAIDAAMAKGAKP